MDGEKVSSQEQHEMEFSRAGVMELAQIENGIFDAKARLEKTPDDPAAALGLEVAERRKELFLSEHDNAGAFKFKKFGRRMQELFEPGPDGKPGIEADAEGRLKLAESQSRRRILLVNMAELDRFNKEGGGHAAGDAALAATAGAVETVVTARLMDKTGAQADYQIYRFDGNTFAVDLADISEEDFEALAAAMREQEPAVEGVKEPAPITVRGLDFKDVVELVNRVQDELPPEGKFEPGEEAARELVEVMRRSSDWEMETHKFLARAERMRDKVLSGDADAALFFENYVKKGFQGTPFATYEGFAEHAKSERFNDMAGELALQAVEQRFAGGRKADSSGRAIIDARVQARGIPEKLAAAEGGVELADTATTQGEQELARKRGEADLAARMAEGASGPEGEMAVLRAEKAKLEHQIEVARRDKGTGLLERGVHYEDLEKAIGEGRDVANVFVDMGFLKYFDQMGGADVGDRALKTAASLMEQAVAAAGVEGRVYRYGGDEFTIQVEGGEAAAQKVMRALEDLRALSAPIAAGEKSRAEYAPTRLAFNYGRADKAMLDELFDVAVREGKYTEDELADPETVRNKKAELMTQAADVGIEYNKAYSRFMMLIDELRSPEYADDPKRKAQVDALIGFSNKAIFAEAGGATKLHELARDRALTGEALEEAVLDYVVDKVGEARAKEAGQKQLVDLLLAAQTKISFLNERLQDLEQVTETQGHKIEELQGMLRKAQEEREQILQARSAIDRAA